MKQILLFVIAVGICLATAAQAEKILSIRGTYSINGGGCAYNQGASTWGPDTVQSAFGICNYNTASIRRDGGFPYVMICKNGTRTKRHSGIIYPIDASHFVMRSTVKTTHIYCGF